MAAVMCGVCKAPLQGFQLLAGARPEKGAPELVGHYVCVVEALKPDRVLTLVRTGRLPNIDPASLVDGRLPKYHEAWTAKQAAASGQED